jgi:luciferase family oxidoreductase group 1
METLASPAPEILISRVAAETTTIRVGSGGVLLPHYSPLKVAEVFRMLHAMYPNRIDLGIGRAPGGSPLEARALRRDGADRLPADDFPERLAELLAFLNDDFPASHPYSRIRVSPKMPGGPEVWLLGSSLWSASTAAQFGLPYAFAHFIDPQLTRSAAEHYRSSFMPSRNLKRPKPIVALGAICAPTDPEAERLASSARLLMRRIRQGDLRPVATPEEAVRELRSSGYATVPEMGEWPRYIVGSPDRVRKQLTEIASGLHIEEIMIVTIVHDHKARLQSYELVAEAFQTAPVTSR